MRKGYWELRDAHMKQQIAMAQVAGMFSEGIEAEPSESRAAQKLARADRFRETLRQRLTRNLLGLAYACQPGRIAGAGPLLAFAARSWLVSPAA